MGGMNPYIKKAETQKASKKFSIRFEIPANPVASRTIEVDPSNIPQSGTGLPGSILDLAMASDIDIDHACGGVCACSTCHVVVKKGFTSCSESTEDEDDQLEKAPGLTPFSRLACQCVPNGNEDLVVILPNWNRNLVREG